MAIDTDHLAPPRPSYAHQPHYTVPLSPADRPPFHQYHSSGTLPPTPQTPYPPPMVVGYETPRRGLKPYLTLPPRLLLTTLSPALLPLILTIAHLIQNRSSTADLADSLRASLLSACAGLAKGAASIRTIPRYLAMQTNEEMIRATQASILALGALLMDCVTIVQVVVDFIIDTYRSLLMCTLELAVRGTLEILIAAVREISSAITSSLNSIRTSILNDIASANNLIKGASEKLNAAASTFGISISIPTFSIPSLSALENVQIPTGFEDSLVRLNQTIPTLDQLRSKISEIIGQPFELLKAEINETRIEMAAGFNSSLLPTPPLSALSAQGARELENELCGSLDTGLIDDTANALNRLSTIAIALMFLVLFLTWAALCIWEWRRWHAMKMTVDTVERDWTRDGTRDAWRVVQIVEHPMLERYGSPLLVRMTSKERTQNNIRWYLSYLAHPTCLALLFIASLGFLSLQFQMLALNGIKEHARQNANASVTASSASLASKINEHAMEASQQYATDFNTAIAKYQQRIDEELFGPWLNATAVQLNHTLNEFYDGVEEALNTVFGNTPLATPMNTFLYCILGSKIDSLEKALTWVSKHAHITLPTVPPNVLMLSDASMNEMTGPIAAAAVGGSDGSDEGLVGKLINHFESALRAERNFYAILLGVWLGFALIGLLVVLWNCGAAEQYDAWRSSGGDNGDAPKAAWNNGKTPIADEYTDNPPASRPGTSNSFFNYGTRRPQTARQTTFGSLASLVAPGAAFLGIGRKTPDGEKQVYGSSERYNEKHAVSDVTPRDVETPPPFWVNKWYGAVGNVKSLFPSREQRHGEAVQRDASFGPTGWQPTQPGAMMRTDDGRYPTLSSSSGSSTESASYPRRMSRAPTPRTGAGISHINPFDPPPPHPPTNPFQSYKHDSLDYVDRHGDGEDLYDDYYDPRTTPLRDTRGTVMSPVSTVSEAELGDVHRVQTGTAALAAILANMQRRERREDPFESPYDAR